MDLFIYFLFIPLYIACGYLLYKHTKFDHKLKQNDENNKKSLAEAGNAITETLRVAFDNLKRNASDHNKINGKLTEYNSRIHRLEQNHNRLSRDKGGLANIKQDTLKDENEQRRTEND